MADSARAKYPLLKLLDPCTQATAATHRTRVCQHENGIDSVTQTRGPWTLYITYSPQQTHRPSVLYIMLRQ
nr:E4 [Human papillomavirus type 34]